MDLVTEKSTQRFGCFAARAASAFCLAFAGFQVALALGAPYGDIAWGGSTRVLSTTMRLASLGAAAYLLLASAAMLVRAQDIGRHLPQAPFRWFNIFLAAQLALNTVANFLRIAQPSAWAWAPPPLWGAPFAWRRFSHLADYPNRDVIHLTGQQTGERAGDQPSPVLRSPGRGRRPGLNTARCCGVRVERASSCLFRSRAALAGS